MAALQLIYISGASCAEIVNRLLAWSPCFAFAAVLALLLHHFLVGGLLADACAQLFFGFLHRTAHGLAGDKQGIFAVFAA